MSEQALMIQAIQAAGNARELSQAQGMPAVQDSAAVEKFQAAMSAGKLDDIPFIGQVEEAWKSAEVNHQGLLHRIKALNELKMQHGPSMAELTELQYEVATLSFQQEVVTNVAKKASDAVQTLIKNS